MANKIVTADIEKYCVFCEYGTSVPADIDGTELVLCSKKGMVRGNAVCRKFSYDPLKREPTRRPELPEIEIVDIDEL
jgi:hypothetical protein